MFSLSLSPSLLQLRISEQSSLWDTVSHVVMVISASTESVHTPVNFTQTHVCSFILPFQEQLLFLLLKA